MFTKNRVAVDDPITKSGAVPTVAVGLIEKKPHGVVLPTPTNPFELTLKSDAPVDDATLKTSTDEVP